MIELLFGIMGFLRTSTIQQVCDGECVTVVFHSVSELPPFVQRMEPCEHEDSPGPCYWDADNRGNKVGRSYWVTSDQIVHIVRNQEIA